MDSIGALAGTTQVASAEKGIFVAGLATAPITYNISFYDASLKKLDDNATCLLPTEIDIFISYYEARLNPIIEEFTKARDAGESLQNAN